MPTKTPRPLCVVYTRPDVKPEAFPLSGESALDDIIIIDVIRINYNTLKVIPVVVVGGRGVFRFKML